MYGPDDANSGVVDLILPDNPAIITQATSRIWVLFCQIRGMIQLGNKRVSTEHDRLT